MRPFINHTAMEIVRATFWERRNKYYHYCSFLLDPCSGHQFDRSRDWGDCRLCLWPPKVAGKYSFRREPRGSGVSGRRSGRNFCRRHIFIDELRAHFYRPSPSTHAYTCTYITRIRGFIYPRGRRHQSIGTHRRNMRIEKYGIHLHSLLEIKLLPWSMEIRIPRF